MCGQNQVICMSVDTYTVCLYMDGTNSFPHSAPYPETLIPAELVTGPSIVREGDDVEFTCQILDPQKVANSSFVHCYLIKNRAIVLVQVFDIQKMKAIFTIKALSNAASGNYSCVLLLLDSLTKKDAELHGSTAVSLQVKERGKI